MRSIAATLKKGEFRRFATVGGVGFFIDGGLLTFLMHQGLEVIPARSISFFCAVNITWILNRRWTFESIKPASHKRGFILYIGTQILGIAINLSIFFVLILFFLQLKAIPLLPLAIGAAISLAFNYMVSKIFIFKV